MQWHCSELRLKLRSIGRRAGGVRDPTVISREKAGRNLSELLAAHATRPRRIAHGKLERRERHALVKALLPPLAFFCGCQELLAHWPARRLRPLHPRRHG